MTAAHTPGVVGFTSRDGHWYAEDVALESIAASVGTPAYVYSRAVVESRWREFDGAFGDLPHRICYAVKANGNLGVLSLLARLGAGFDLVSGGELERVLRAGGDPARCVFSGVGKSTAELELALRAGVGCINVESAPELARLQRVAAALDITARAAIRVNPDVDARTHPHIATGLRETKFGVPMPQARTMYLDARTLSHVRLTGVACHIGSQLTELAPFAEAADRVLGLARDLIEHGVAIEHIDLGGGLGIRYREESPPTPGEYVATLCDRLRACGVDVALHLEPGRAIVGDAGVLLTRVEYVKHASPKAFAVVDAAMNDLLRPAMYGAWMGVVEVNPSPDAPEGRYDVVGPVCETADTLAHDRLLRVTEGDLLAITQAGAYGAVMASNYNTRPRAPEVIVDGADVHVTRRRETLDDILAQESCFPDTATPGSDHAPRRVRAV